MSRAMLGGLFCWAFFCALEGRSQAQPSASWRIYGAADGFLDSFQSVTVSENGTVVAVSSAASNICVFDGYDVKDINLPPWAGDRVYQSPAGQLWMWSSNGLCMWRDGSWQLLSLTELGLTEKDLNGFDAPLYPLRQNVVLCLFPRRLVEVNAETPRPVRTEPLLVANETGVGEFSGMAVDGSDQLWVAGVNGLARSPGTVRGRLDGRWRIFAPPASLRLHGYRNPKPDESGLSLVADAVDGGQALVHFDGANWETSQMDIGKVQCAWRGPDHSDWAITTDGLFQKRNTTWTRVANLTPREYRDMTVDGRGTFWLATSKGLVRFTPSLWEESEPDFPPNAAVRALAENGSLRDVADELLTFSSDNQSTRPVATPGGVVQARPLGLLRDGRVCFGVNNTNATPAGTRLEAWDGSGFRPLPFAPPNPGADTEFSCILETLTGDIWLGGPFGVAWLHNRWAVFPSSDKSLPREVRHLAESPDGQIWAASRQRIWCFDGKNWSTVRTGLSSITAMICSRDGSIWVGERNGLMRFHRGHWMENGMDEGLNENPVVALCEDKRGGIWALGSNSVARFHPEADSDPPRTWVVPLTEKGASIPEDGEMKINFGGRDKWEITSSRSLAFSCKLDESDWSVFAPRTTEIYSDLPAGKHYFQVRAMDRAGNVDPTPAHLEFNVVLPWYQERRLLLIAGAGTTAALFFAHLAYKRHRELALSYAEVEKQVAERSRQLSVANEELLQSQKMRALGTLSAGIAHDFNNILSIIKGAIQIIDENVRSPEKINIWSARIRTVVDQGSTLVQAMLGFSRSSDEFFEACEINPIVNNTINLLGDQFLREVEIKSELAGDLPRVQASQSLVQQILLNLIFNASESMKGRKRIVIRTRRLKELPAAMALKPEKAAEYVAVLIRDFGCGIPPENIARIFEPFFTTKALSVQRGTGLGLSIVYELAKKMRAGLSIESTVGQGSVFALILTAGAAV